MSDALSRGKKDDIRAVAYCLCTSMPINTGQTAIGFRRNFQDSLVRASIVSVGLGGS